MTFFLLSLAALVLLVMTYQGRGFRGWIIATVLAALAWFFAPGDPALIRLLVILSTASLILFGTPPLRRVLISGWAMRLMGKALPSLGDTEEIALKAGGVWWEGEIFSGKPDWRQLLEFSAKELTPREQAFLDGPTDELCALIDDWQVAQDRDLAPAVWDCIKRHKFLGMIIPEEFGGLGFSAAAHAAVITRISSRSVTAAVTVMVPNSLGPAELLLHYGTEEQKSRYLQGLSTGEEIPCFALTEPHAGSDAASGRSAGIVCRGSWEGEEVLGMKLTFDKRYITLAPVATVVGLAFRLFDPDHLLGDNESLGICCALIPRQTPGLEIGNRHDTMGVPFQNGPVRGQDVFVPLDFIIGGRDYIGQGWRMLMEQLSAGRGISLPSLSVGAAQLSTRAVSGYARVREQFGLPIGKFEGVRERLVRIAGYTYFMNATGKLTVGAVDAGKSPAVATGIAKAYLTEGMRLCLNDAMDLLAGSAICRGPANILSRAYISIPIGITVEGANILTRSMIIFGQGAIRCHPFVLQEMEAIAKGDVKAFDKALFAHFNHISRNKVRSFALALTGARLTPAPVTGPAARYYQHINRLSASFAFVTDSALVILGGSLKRREYLSGRFADTLAWLYMATATLKQFADSDDPNRDEALMHWAMTYSLYQAEQALATLLQNMPWIFGPLLKVNVFPFGPRLKPPSDRQCDAVADVLLDPASGLRDALTPGLFIPDMDDPGLGKLEDACLKLQLAAVPRDKIQQARRAGKVHKNSMEDMARDARDQNLISESELTLVLDAQEAMNRAIQVDDFTPEGFRELK